MLLEQREAERKGRHWRVLGHRQPTVSALTTCVIIHYHIHDIVILLSSFSLLRLHVHDRTSEAVRWCIHYIMYIKGIGSVYKRQPVTNLNTAFTEQVNTEEQNYNQLPIHGYTYNVCT